MEPTNILLVAYQCGPGMGSVSQIGWEWYLRLSVNNNVTLVTHIRNKKTLDTLNLPADGGEIIYIDTEWFAGPLYRLAKRIFPVSEHSVFLVSSLDYFVFDFVAYRQLKKLIHSGKKWQLLHRVTPVTLAAPSWLGRLGFPTIIGPLNSGLTDPNGFGEIMKQESSWLIKTRHITKFIDTLIGSTKRVNCILTANRTTLKWVDPRYQTRCKMMLENGVELNRFTVTPWPAFPDQNEPLKILFIGRLVPLKGVDMLIKALSMILKTGKAANLTIVGDGPMMQVWKDLSLTLGIDQYVKFEGAQPLDVIPSYMHACHVFCLPSVRESGGAVLLEAMACSRPVIALNFGGPSEIVNEKVGSLLPMNNPEQVTNDIFNCLLNVINAPEDWRQRGIQGRHEVEELYSWDAKISSAEKIYQKFILNKGLS